MESVACSALRGCGAPRCRDRVQKKTAQRDRRVDAAERRAESAEGVTGQSTAAELTTAGLQREDRIFAFLCADARACVRACEVAPVKQDHCCELRRVAERRRRESCECECDYRCGHCRCAREIDAKVFGAEHFAQQNRPYCEDDACSEAATCTGRKHAPPTANECANSIAAQSTLRTAIRARLMRRWSHRCS